MFKINKSLHGLKKHNCMERNKLMKMVEGRRKKVIENLGVSEEEFFFMADCLNGVVCNTDFYNCLGGLLGNFEDNIEFYQTDKKHKINYDELRDKLLHSSYEKLLILIYEIERFWEDDFSDIINPRLGGGKNPMEALRDYILTKD